MPPKRQRDEDEPVNVIKTQAQAHALERKLRRDLDLDEELQSKELRGRDLSLSDKDKLIEEYISGRFIVLKVYLGDYDATKLSPPILVDELWHAHILNTKSYRNMCYNICETKFIDHDPEGSWDGGREKRLGRALGAYGVMWPGEETGNWVWEGDDSASEISTPPPTLPCFPRADPDDDRTLNIKLVSSDQQEVFFKIGRNTRLYKLIPAYADRVGADPTSIRLIFDGKRITLGQTAEDLDLEDGDAMEVILEQAAC